MHFKLVVPVRVMLGAVLLIGLGPVQARAPNDDVAAQMAAHTEFVLNSCGNRFPEMKEDLDKAYQKWARKHVGRAQQLRGRAAYHQTAKDLQKQKANYTPALEECAGVLVLVGSPDFEEYMR